VRDERASTRNSAQGAVRGEAETGTSASIYQEHPHQIYIGRSSRGPRPSMSGQDPRLRCPGARGRKQRQAITFGPLARLPLMTS